MDRRNIVVMGASYGGITAYSKIFSSLSQSLRAAIFVVQHISPDYDSRLHDVLSRGSALKAVKPRDHQLYEEGIIYTAVPDHHLLVKNAHIRIVQGPRENRFRPSIDALFRSAAAYHGSRVVAILLTGYLDDGVSGLEAVKRCGGITVVQEPSEAEAPELLENALQRLPVDFILPLKDIAGKLPELVDSPAPPPVPVPEDIMQGAQVSEHEIPTMDAMQRIAKSTPFTCPDCGGVLWKIKNDSLHQLRCVTGHAFSLEACLKGQANALENSLWGAIRFMEERIKLLEVLAAEARTKAWNKSAEQYAKTLEELKQHAGVLRNFIMSGILEPKRE